MDESGIPAPIRRRPVFWKLLAAGGAGTVAYAALAPFAGFGSGMGPALLMLLVMAATWLIVCSIINRAVVQSVFGRLAVLGIGLVLTFVYFQVELLALGYAIEHFLPRPVFHNRFVWHERAVLPYWYPPFPVCDEFGQYIQADHELNLLAIALTGTCGDRAPGVIRGTTRGFSVKVKRTVEFEKTSDTLVVVLPDGTSKQFRIEPDLAKRFEEDAEKDRDQNLLRRCRELLPPQDRSAFDTFVAAYAEPIPPRPLFHHDHDPALPPRAPYWHLTEPRRDEQRNRGWADFPANLVVIVIESNHRLSEASYRHDAVRFYFPSTYKSITVAREESALVVVKGDRTTRKIAAPPGFAEAFYRTTSNKTHDLLDAAARLLPEAVRKEVIVQ